MEDAGDTGGPGAGDYQLMVCSAHSQTALDQITANLGRYFKSHPRINLADAAYTLQVGRKELQYRRMAVCRDTTEAVDIFSTPGHENLGTRGPLLGGQPPVVFMFPGQGAQYVNMARELYDNQPIFRREIDRCLDIAGPLTGSDLKDILFPAHQPGSPGTIDMASDIYQTRIAQPIVFSFEYALAQLLMEWGIRPWAMIGHSLGEYTAACLSGALSLPDALAIVTLRGKLIQQLPTGAMLSVSLPLEELTPILGDGITLAAVNTPSLCVVSGTQEAIDTFAGNWNNWATIAGT